MTAMSVMMLIPSVIFVALVQRQLVQGPGFRGNQRLTSTQRIARI